MRSGAPCVAGLRWLYGWPAWRPLVLLTLLLLSRVGVAQSVVVVVVDGARFPETFGGTGRWIPRMWNDLRPEGTLWVMFRNEGITTTNPGHASIVSGTWQTIPNDGSTRPTRPTVFEYFRKERNLPDSATLVAAGKGKLEIITHSTHPDYGARFGAVFAPGTNDRDVVSNVLGILSRSHPRLVVANLPDVDLAAHASDSLGYLSSLWRADSLVGVLWTFLQEDSFYAGNTTLFVTNDHGRHERGFSDHGDGCEGCRHIMLLGLGRGMRKGKVVTKPRTQIDIAPAIGDLLGFHVPFADGTSICRDTGFSPGLR